MMHPSELTAASFTRYPSKGRDTAIANLNLLRELPLPLCASILRQLSCFDWLFPAERNVMTAQFNALVGMNQPQRAQTMASFGKLEVQPSLSQMDWVNDPKRFLEALTAYLWSSHQIDAFHAAATSYADAVKLGASSADPPIPRAGLVIVSRELDKPGYPLFRKLRKQGVFFESVPGELTTDQLSAWIGSRTKKFPLALTHFYIDGDEPLPVTSEHLHTMSWSGVSRPRQALLERMHRIMNTPGSGPELARTELASLSPADLGMRGAGDDAVMDHFTLSVLSEGSGTQIFSTTFAQWGAREVLRRAEPSTLMVRFGPRQQLQPMNAMLAGTAPSASPDLPGSFVDADMAAYYTWINQQRLPGASSGVFVAYCEARRQAVAIGPGLPKGTTSPQSLHVEKLMALLS
jgi:hypothetical protein